MELIDVLDENGKITGRVEDRKTVHEQGLWHTHVGVWIMNKNGELLFQKRSATKPSNPNIWSRTGGHADSGETPLQAIQRETAEEIGVEIPLEKFELINVSKFEKTNAETQKTVRDFTYSYFSIVDYKLDDYTMQEEEVSDLKYVSIEDMRKAKENDDRSYTFAKWDRSNFDYIVGILEKKREELVN